MKTSILSLAVAVGLPMMASADGFLNGDLLLVRVGDGQATLANTGNPISLLEINPSGSIVQTINLPSGNGGLQVSGVATSEGQLVRNADGSYTIAGYVPPYGGSGSLSGRSSANAPRGYVTVANSGTVSSTTTLTGTYSGQNIRSGFVSGGGAWFTGSGTASGSGLVYYNGSSSSSIQGVNSRVLGYYNGNLYYSTGSGTQGIYKYNGLPTAATTSSAFLTGVTGQGTSPYDFAISPDGNTMYVADDGIGVQKFTFNGSAWSLAYNFTDGLPNNDAYGLAVDFSAANPVIYLTSTNALWSVTDTGSAATAHDILDSGANYNFRGLEIVPEPTAVALVGLGLSVFIYRRRVRK